MMDDSRNELLRLLPSVDTVLTREDVREAAAGTPHALVVRVVRDAVDGVRDRLLAGKQDEADAETVEENVAIRALDLLREAARPRYRKVVNATGIILHTGLGRAVLAEKAVRRIGRDLSGYSILQLDPETGVRCRRDARIESLLQTLTGAEAATVVNNNAAATLLVLNTVAQGKEVIVSRGQLVEIGGSFRLPDVMAASGARMVEVGTTNRTHLRDYENAVTEQTAAILRVHPSNYKIEGFSSEVPLADMVELAHARGLVLIDDVGAGGLIDFSRFGFSEEPTLPDSIRAGADLTTSSADKLIGAGQGGVILGRRELVERARRNPLARAVRVDKLTLAVLEETLTLWLDEDAAMTELPILRMLRRTPEGLQNSAERIAERIGQGLNGAAARVEVVPGHSQMGSGSLPGQNLPTSLVALGAPAVPAHVMALALRRHEPPVYTRIKDGKVMIDPRTLLEGEQGIVVDAAISALREEGA